MTSTWFQRYFLPGLAFKAIVIGGGYATGRELAEFFLPRGPWGGVAAMLLAMVIWAIVAAATFYFAHVTRSYDYRSFFKLLLGPAWYGFEIVYVLLLVLILAVFGASAGAIVEAITGWPSLVGTLALVGCIAAVVAFGNTSVERVFKWVSIVLYLMYALFILFSLDGFGARIVQSFSAPAPAGNWALSGLTYAGYNIVGAVVVLPVARHFQSKRDAISAGLIAGPLAMLPALLFFVCMTAFYPQIGSEVLPSDYLLNQLEMPAFHLAFQGMIFLALLESGSGALHAINERIANTVRSKYGTDTTPGVRMAIAGFILLCSIFVAGRFGLVTLIAKGYSLLSYLLIAVYVVPLLALGTWRLSARARLSA